MRIRFPTAPISLHFYRSAPRFPAMKVIGKSKITSMSIQTALWALGVTDQEKVSPPIIELILCENWNFRQHPLKTPFPRSLVRHY